MLKKILAIITFCYLLTASSVYSQSSKEDSLNQLLASSVTPLEKASFLSALGAAYYLTGEFAKSIENCNKALTIYKKQHVDTGIANEMFSLGRIYSDLGEYPRA